MNGVCAPASPTSADTPADRAVNIDLAAPSSPAGLVFKLATEPWEFEQIHRLNYRTFVEEIPQHQANPDGRLVDRFHPHNTYFVCLQDQRVVGMISVHFERPFSLDQKVGNLERYLPPGATNLAEVRLLATEKEHRGGRVLLGLLGELCKHLVERRCDLAIISGTTRQLRLYRHLGFVPFGPLIGTPGAMYQPMYVTREKFKEIARGLLPSLHSDDGFGAVSFLPGPVDLTPQVRQAFASNPLSHRSDQFLDDFRQTQQALCRLTAAPHVQILTGSGTLANDVVGAQISLLNAPGIILSNGEFGDRLIDQANRMGLDFIAHRRSWGDRFDPGDLEAQIAADPSIKWLWAVHCETSTGMLNNLEGLKRISARHGLKLCLDCISSIGTVAVDLAGVHLASGISGKGLRAYPGLSLVFHNDDIEPQPMRLPRYLDLGFYAAKSGVPFTLCSNLLYALKAAIAQLDPQTRFDVIARNHAYIRQQLLEMGMSIIAPEADASPAVISIALPHSISALRVGDRLADAGFQLSYKSDYLLERNWVQICLMGQYAPQTLDQMLAALRRHTARRQR